MSLELHVFLKDAKVPARDAWQKAIEAAGFLTVLDKKLDLRHDTGFRPMTYNDQKTGFEFHLDLAEEYLDCHPAIVKPVGSRDMCVSFHFSSDHDESAAAMSAAAALTKLADGIYFDPQNEHILKADEVLEAIRQEIDSI